MPRIPLYDPAVQLTHLGPGLELDSQSFGVEGRARAQNLEAAGRSAAQAGQIEAHYLERAGRSEALNLAASANTWGEMAEFGNKLATVGLTLGAALQQAKRVDLLASMKLETYERLNHLSEEVKQDPDPAKWPEKFKTAGQEFYQKTMERTSDPDVQAHYKAAWASHFPVKAQAVTAASRKQQIADFAGNLEVNYGKSIELFQQAGSGVERAKIKGEAFALLQGGVAAGFLAPAKAQQLRDGFDHAVTIGEINRQKLTDPAGTLAAIREPGAFGLDDTERAKLIPDLTANLHRAQQENALQVQQWYEGKKLTPENLRGMRDAKVISLGTWKFYDAALQADMAPVKTEQDMDLYVNRLKQAMAGTLNVDQTMEELKAGKHTAGRAEHLIAVNAKAGKGETTDDMAFTKSPYYKTALWELQRQAHIIDNSVLKKTEAITGKTSATAQGQATVMFLDKCREAHKKGIEPGAWMMDTVKEIVPLFMASDPFKKQGGSPAAPPAQQTGIPVKNNRTGAVEYVTPAEYDLIIKNQGGRR